MLHMAAFAKDVLHSSKKEPMINRESFTILCGGAGNMLFNYIFASDFRNIGLLPHSSTVYMSVVLQHSLN